MPLLLLLVVLLAGCSADRGVPTYLRQLAPFQQSLVEFKSEMAAVQNLPLEKRSAAYVALAGRVRARADGLKILSVPPRMVPLHADTQELYALLAEYLDQASRAGGPTDPKLQELAARWQATAARAESRLK